VSLEIYLGGAGHLRDRSLKEVCYSTVLGKRTGFFSNPVD